MSRFISVIHLLLVGSFVIMLYRFTLHSVRIVTKLMVQLDSLDIITIFKMLNECADSSRNKQGCIETDHNRKVGYKFAIQKNVVHRFNLK